LSSKHQTSEGNFEPYLTLRGHTAPLLAIAGGHGKNERCLFTSDTEGEIRVWHAPLSSEVNMYGDTSEGKNYAVDLWSSNGEGDEEAVWDLKYHPYQHFLLSVSATSSILTWDCSSINPEGEGNRGHVAREFSYTVG
jgi:WD40 repeat protein